MWSQAFQRPNLTPTLSRLVADTYWINDVPSTHATFVALFCADTDFCTSGAHGRVWALVTRRFWSKLPGWSTTLDSLFIYFISVLFHSNSVSLVFLHTNWNKNQISLRYKRAIGWLIYLQEELTSKFMSITLRRPCIDITRIWVCFSHFSHFWLLRLSYDL